MNLYSNLLKNARLLLYKLAGNYNQKGSNNNAWKGDKASYSAKHKRGANGTSKNSKGSKCVQCGSTKNLHYVTIHGTNGKQHKTLCASCHSKYDKKESNFKK